MKHLMIILLSCFFLYASGNEPEGNIYWVQFNTKAGTPYSINQPHNFLSNKALERREKQSIDIDSTDLPVNPQFSDSLRSMGFYIKHTSRWMNGAIAIYADSLPAIDSLILPSFVTNIELRKSVPLKSFRNKFNIEEKSIQNNDSTSLNLYGIAASQLTMHNGHKLHKYSTGEGATIAVIDAGFQDADMSSAFDSLFLQGRMLGTYDFVSPGGNVYKTHYHGTNVLSIMAGNIPEVFVGTAPHASYWLLRSEDAPTEFPVEEDYWIIAAEFADSVGCNVINTSLGYTVFDDNSLNHSYGEFTGDSLRISKAANMAVNKGIIVVCSAGNDGNNSWHYVSAPAEASNVLSVAAVDNQKNIASFSSRGFGDSLHSVKPDVAATGSGTAIFSATGDATYGSGTSYSSPVISGLSACLSTLYPDLSAHAIINMIRRAGDLFPQHSIDFGYGIPDFSIYLPKDTTGVTFNDFGTQISVFPNPISDYIEISSSTYIGLIELCTAQGTRLLSLTPAKEQNRVRISDEIAQLPGGLYFLRIWSDRSFLSGKLIKK